MRLFFAAVFLIEKAWKQPRVLINRGLIHTMVYVRLKETTRARAGVAQWLSVVPWA